MIRRFISFEWKQFIRSSYWQKSIALKILMILMALYFIVMFLALGFGLYPVLKKQFPDSDPLQLFNQFLFYWLLADLLLRFFMQKLPVMRVKPFLVLPVKRSRVVHYVLGKTLLSFFNFLPLFAVIPFGIVLISKGYGMVPIFTWIVLIFIFTLIVNFTNFLIESKSSGTDLSFLPVIALTGGLFTLDYFHIVPLSGLLGDFIEKTIQNPLWILIPLTLLATVYFLNFQTLINQLYVDDSLQSKAKTVQSSDMLWAERFGDAAPFIKLDLRLIWRNKRTRSMIYLLVMGLLYGLIFYPNKHYENMMPMFVFVGIFVTGIFMINFGQFIPAWDSAYYKLLMSQNIRYKEYLNSKFLLMAVSAVILFTLSIPYVYFGWKILLIHFAAMIYNIGINTHILLLGGAFNRKRIDLSQQAAFNYQGTGAVQWIIGFPLLIIPVGVFYLPYKFWGFTAGIATLIVMGALGIVFHQLIMKYIVSKYTSYKYETIAAFDKKN